MKSSALTPLPVSSDLGVDNLEWRRILNSHVLTLQCPDRPGIIHAVTQALLAFRSNIIEQAQFTDPATRIFCLRTVFETPEPDPELIRGAVDMALDLPGAIAVRPTTAKRRALIMVSKLDHCLNDLLYRQAIGELRIDIPLIVSNHEACRVVADRYGIPFEAMEVTPETKADRESRLYQLIQAHSVDVVVLARYMQVLSDDLCNRLSGRVINIHHSFLPGFKGARPYHQAHHRGVKLIGATAHFVTSDLDEGPIIEQDVYRVSHSDTADDLTTVGRDVERRVLSTAVALFAEDRVFLCGQRTVVLR